jgi:hypothetical protein
MLAIVYISLASCQTRLTITQSKIHKSSKFDGSFSICKIKVDSFSANGIPTKFRTDSTFYCNANTEPGGNSNTASKARYKKTIKFNKSNKYYTWYTWKDNERSSKYKLTKIHFEPLQWYYLYLDWSYGFLTTGHRSSYFYFDKNGKITLVFEDHVNDGPF